MAIKTQKKNPEEDTSHKAILREMERKYDQAYEELTPRFRKFNDYEDLYLGFLDNMTNPWKSSVFDPESFEKVERMVSHLFATRPRGRYMPREGADTVGVRIADELFAYQWDKNGQQMHRKLTRVGRNAGIFGTGFGLLTWRYEKRKQKMVKKDGKLVTKEVCVWDDPFFQDLYIYDCFPDPTASSIEDMAWFIHNDYVTLDDLKDNNYEIHGEKRYVNLGVLEEKFNKTRKSGASVDSLRDRYSQTKNIDNTDMEGRILVRRYYDRSKWVSWCPDYNLVIESRSNPYWHGEIPVHGLNDHDFPNQLYGIGEIEPIERLQRGLNSVLNQRLDNVRMIMNPAIKVLARSKYSKEWKMAPGWKWRMDKLDEADIFQIPDATGLTFLQTTNYFKDSISRALGHQDFISRNESANDKTATEIRAAGGEQNARMRAKEYNVDAFIQRLATQWMQLNQQFITEERVIRLVGRDAVQFFAQMKDKLAVDDPRATVGDDTEETPKMMRQATYGGRDMDKLAMGDDGGFALLVVEPEDLKGGFDYVVETGSTTPIDTAQQQANTESAIKTLLEVEERLMKEGKQIHYAAVIEKDLAELGFKNTDEIIVPMDEKAQAAMSQPEQAVGPTPPMMQQPMQMPAPMPAPMPQMAPPVQVGAPQPGVVQPGGVNIPALMPQMGNQQISYVPRR